MHSETWQRRNLEKGGGIGMRPLHRWPGALEPQNQKDHLALSGPWKDKGAKRLMPRERGSLCDWQMWLKKDLLFILPVNLVHHMRVPPAVT